MPCFTVPPGVRFNDCLFSDPVPLSAWHPPSCPGIVAILARNPQWGPKPLQPLYFGELGNGATRSASLPANVHRPDLLVSMLAMPYSTPAQRRAICRDLIAAYHPACQINASATELAHRVDELQEQNQQILSLLSHLAKLFEPLPVGPRKPIGFLPELAAAGTAATESGS